MKVFINCDCEILSATLEKILSNSITSQSDADIIICEREFASNKPLFIIGKDITQPFSEAELKQKLSEFLNKSEFLEKKTQSVPEKNFAAFEKSLDEILLSFKKQILELFKNAK
ncbi:MAG: hypothetical protein SPH77_00150 [Campylobacter sp.]|uniref:hypothetical protein n=1 Tax=Campylobacter sp. TaxID=205 RepID=UPI002A910F6A|nr:hypothetical protein [Campylobacter sp.]MCI6178455.1 hypothetical protein [Campylobacter sp.]MDY6187231.1 hypothetical protein [Campylobacter sp.]